MGSHCRSDFSLEWIRFLSHFLSSNTDIKRIICFLVQSIHLDMSLTVATRMSTAQTKCNFESVVVCHRSPFAHPWVIRRPQVSLKGNYLGSKLSQIWERNAGLIQHALPLGGVTTKIRSRQASSMVRGSTSGVPYDDVRRRSSAVMVASVGRGLHRTRWRTVLIVSDFTRRTSLTGTERSTLLTLIAISPRSLLCWPLW